MKHKLLFFVLILIFLAACGPVAESLDDVVLATAVSPTSHQGIGTGMGSNSSMRDRHHASIPEEYASLTNPVASDDESLVRGAAVYTAHCLTCHGESGQGDGPTSAELDPAPVAIAHTSQMMSNAYLFYRVSEGGLFAPFNSNMPAWKDILDEQARWDVINYVRALGSGQAEPDRQDSNAAYDPAAEAAKHAEMIAEGVAQGLITQADGDVFLAVHDALDVLLVADNGETRGGGESRQTIFLRQLVDEGQITQEESDLFTAVHDTLLAVGLME
jgi:mono/diheme cytochrome c family protein